jgi:hypothetical protein
MDGLVPALLGEGLVQELVGVNQRYAPISKLLNLYRYAI